MTNRLNQPTDEALMTSVAKGDLEAMRILFERYHIPIYNYLLKMSKDQSVSQDICQEVFYKAIKYRNSYNRQAFLPWIYRIARNLYIDHYRREKEQGQELDVSKLSVSAGERPLEKADSMEVLYLAIDQLNEVDRELLIMNRLQGIGYAEIAEITKSSVGAVKTRIHRIIGKLRIHFFKHH